jgi:hypothetical protein
MTTDIDPLPPLFRIMPTRVRALFGSWTSHFYERISSQAAAEKDDCGEQEQNSGITRPRAFSTRRFIILVVLASCVVLLVTVIMTTAHQTHPKIWDSCGDGPEMARSRGCQFDVINFAWQTRECFDASLVAEFAEIEPWTFWVTSTSNETVPQYV